MKIKENKKEKVTVLVIEGRIDSTTSTELEKKLTALIETDGVKDIAMDFSTMDYISSAGLRVLLMAAKKAGKLGGKVVFSSLSTEVKEVFDISGFSNIFNIYPSQEEAIRSF